VVPAVPPDTEYRRFLETQATGGKAAELFSALQEADPIAAGKIDPHNIRRVIRALEIIQKTGKSFSAQRLKQPPPFDFRIVGLTMERRALYDRVNARVDDMLKQGFIDEVRKLISKGYSLDLPSMSSIGYREIGLYLQGEMPLEEAVEKIKIGTHRFIRHQYAWFKKADPRIEWFDAANDPTIILGQ
jgi:tRNA dimethylallyltransferase